MTSTSTGERCATCTGGAPGWPCKTEITGGGKPIYFGCLKDAQACYVDGKFAVSSGRTYGPSGPEVYIGGQWVRESVWI